MSHLLSTTAIRYTAWLGQNGPQWYWFLHMMVNHSIATGFIVNHGSQVHIMEPTTSWKFKTKLLAQKNNHGVPLYKIKEMLERYERNVNLESLLLQWNLPELEREEEVEQKCQMGNSDQTEKSSDSFHMKEIAQEVSAIGSQITNESEATAKCSDDTEAKNDGMGIKRNDHETTPKSEDGQDGGEAKSGEKGGCLKLVDYPESGDDESEEYFMSDSDGEWKDSGGTDQTELNPCVPEFVPLASGQNSPLTLPSPLEEGEVAEDWGKVPTDWQGVGGLLRGLREEAGQVRSKNLSYS